MRQWIDNQDCPLPLSFLSNEEKFQKHLLFTYISAQKKHLRSSCICDELAFHTLMALSVLNGNYLENFHIDKRCCVIQCLMLDSKVHKMAMPLSSKRPISMTSLSLMKQRLEEVTFAIWARGPVLFCCPPAHFIPKQSFLSHWWVSSSANTLQNNRGLLSWG